MDQQAIANKATPAKSEAVNELFTSHYRASLQTAYRILRSKEDSEDAVQTAYCAAFRNFHKFRGESSFNTWITRIVVNSCLMQLRERRAKRSVALDDILPALKSHAATPEALCYLAELYAAHSRAASTLPKALRDVYVEYAISGRRLAKVGHALGLTPTAAKSRLFRARKKVEHTLRPVFQRKAA